MQVREAKDFLVQQTAEQAQLENVPFSDLEKRMMYFTESGYVPEDPIKLYEEFDAQHNTVEYEAKIWRLLHHSYHRLRKENHTARKNWDLAIKCLRRGDHYLLVMWDSAPPGERPPGDSLKLLVCGSGIAALALLVGFILARFEPQWRWLRESIPRPNPHVLLGIFLGLIALGLLFKRRSERIIGWLIDNLIPPFGPPKDKGDDGA
jgi:hypothetical protein